MCQAPPHPLPCLRLTSARPPGGPPSFLWGVPRPHRVGVLLAFGHCAHGARPRGAPLALVPLVPCFLAVVRCAPWAPASRAPMCHTFRPLQGSRGVSSPLRSCPCFPPLVLHLHLHFVFPRLLAGSKTVARVSRNHAKNAAEAGQTLCSSKKKSLPAGRLFLLSKFKKRV